MKFIELTVTVVHVRRTDTKSRYGTVPVTALVNCSMIVLVQPAVDGVSGSYVWLSDADGTVLLVEETINAVRAAIVAVCGSVG